MVSFTELILLFFIDGVNLMTEIGHRLAQMNTASNPDL